jgi:hypothetical protein
VASQTKNSVLVVVIEGAAHAINFSHPGELANVIRLFMADQPIVDDPTLRGSPTASRFTAGPTFRRRVDLAGPHKERTFPVIPPLGSWARPVWSALGLEV